MSFRLRQSNFYQNLQNAQLVQNDGQSDQQDEWVEENWTCHVASNVIRSEPSQCNPNVDWDLRILDIFLHKKRELAKIILTYMSSDSFDEHLIDFLMELGLHSTDFFFS